MSGAPELDDEGMIGPRRPADATEASKDAATSGATAAKADAAPDDPLVGPPERPRAVADGAEPATGGAGPKPAETSAAAGRGGSVPPSAAQEKAAREKNKPAGEASNKATAPTVGPVDARGKRRLAGDAPALVALPALDRAPNAGGKRRPSGERRSRIPQFIGVAIAAAICLVIAIAGSDLVGAGDARKDGQAEKADALKAEIGRSEKRLSELDQQRKKTEQALLETQRELNARKSELASAQERADALEKRASSLEKQVATAGSRVSIDKPDAARSEAVRPEVAQNDQRDAARPPMPPLPAPKRSGQRDATADEQDARAAAAGEEGADQSEDMPAGPVRVFIHAQAGSPGAAARARALAAELRREGVTVAGIRLVPHAVQRDTIRFFYDQDVSAVSGLARALRAASPADEPDPISQDFRSYPAPPRPGTMEIWLS